MADLICFRVLGGVELTRGSTSLRLVHRRRRLALFAYLRLSRAPFLSRDVVQATFWPDYDQTRARHSLNSALYVLRRELGADVIVSRGADEIGIAADRVWCDARAFEDALGAEGYAEALELYRGDLMPGFFIPGVPEFERWLEEERSRLRRAAHGAAWKRAESAERAGDPMEAAEWARRAVTMALDDEVVVQRSIRLLDRHGDRVGAMEVFERFSRHLREEYDAEPAPETQRLIAKVRTRVEPLGSVSAGAEVVADRRPESIEPSGHRPVGGPPRYEPVPISFAHHRAVPASTGESMPGHAAPPTRTRRALITSVVLMIGVAGTVGLVRSVRVDSPLAGELGQRPAVTVAAFENLSIHPDHQYLAPAITAAVTAQLAQVQAIELRIGDARRAEASTDAWVGARAVSRQDFLVRGSVLSSATRIRVGVELIDESSGSILRTRTLERSADDLFRLIDEVGREVGDLLRAELGREIQLRRWLAGTANIRAWELLQRAEVDRQRAKALEEGGTFAAAIAQLTKADSLLVLAEREAPAWNDPLVWRARVASDAAWLYYLPPLHDTVRARESLERGIRHARRVLDRDPEHATALELRGTLLYWSSLMAAYGDPGAADIVREAEDHLRAAVSVDGQRPRAWNLLSAILFARGDFANAYWAAHQAYSADAYLEVPEEILVRLALTAYEIGIDSVAWEWCFGMSAETAGGAYCRLNLLAWTDPPSQIRDTDPWEIVTAVSSGAATPESVNAALSMLAANVLARRGLADSARAVIARAGSAEQGDDELLLLEAGARVALGEAESAAGLLGSYVSANPAHRLGTVNSRRFTALTGLLRGPRVTDH